MRAPLRPRDLMAIVLVSAFALAASGTHVVRSGETLSEIAARNGTSVRALVDANGLADADLIIGGTDADASRAAVGPAATLGAPTSCRRATRWAGSRTKFATTVTSIVTANGIDNPNLIVAGKTLSISGAPGAAAGPASASAPSTSSGVQLPGQRHTVSSGDTIYGIARRYGLAQADFVGGTGCPTASSTPPPAWCSSTRARFPAQAPAPRRRPTPWATARPSAASPRSTASAPAPSRRHPGSPTSTASGSVRSLTIPGAAGSGGVQVPGTRCLVLQRLGLPAQRGTVPCRHRHVRGAGHAGRRPGQRLGRHRHRLDRRPPVPAQGRQRHALVRQPHGSLRQDRRRSQPATSSATWATAETPRAVARTSTSRCTPAARRSTRTRCCAAPADPGPRIGLPDR